MTQPTPEAIAAAQAGERKWKIPASVTLAQWAQESGWGHHQPGWNPFGIKARPGEPTQLLNTLEYVHGHPVHIQAAFRRFDSLEQAFDAHDELLANRSPYAHARTLLPDAEAFAMALTGVYATDPLYGSRLVAIMRGSRLAQYDLPPPHGEDLDD